MKAHYISLAPFIPWRQAERPINWARRFGREALLEAEIGFGSGDFLVRRAQAHPERNLVGVELEWPSVRRALRKIAGAETTNVRLIQADAQVALERLFWPGSLHRVYALFPCPWPKERHARRRLFSRRFLQLLNSRLSEGGQVLVVTDQRPYLAWLLGQMPSTGFEVHWQLIPPRFGTKYERKWHRQGLEEFYELRLLKQEPVEIPLKGDTPMKTYHVDAFDPDRFQPSGERGDIVVEFKEYLYDATRRKAMVRVMIVEQSLAQHLWLEIAWGGGRWHIRPARGCELVPTVGLQRALDLTHDAVRRTAGNGTSW